jgi:hypothetical protein
MAAVIVTKDDSAALGVYSMEHASKTLIGCIRVRNFESTLCDHSHRIIPKPLVSGENRALRLDRHGKNHPVERILVVRGQQLRRMADLRSEGFENDLMTQTNLAHKFQNLSLLTGQLKFPKTKLSGDFPHGNAQNHRSSRSCQFPSRHAVCPASSSQIKKRTGVQHMRGHPSSFHSDSQMSSALKAIRSFHRESGTSVRLTGSSTRTIRKVAPREPLRITTSSPCSTLRKRSERLFLALRTVVSIVGYISQIFGSVKTVARFQMPIIVLKKHL